MNTLDTHVANYLEYCNFQKRLDSKTLKAYRIDLRQFVQQLPISYLTDVTAMVVETYIVNLHQQYKPKTVKRKIASVKAFFHYLEFKEILEQNPFSKIQIHFREPVVLPKTIPLHTVELFLSTIYEQHAVAKTKYQQRQTLRDIAIIELLFATGMRISELCSLANENVNLYDGTILIYGKGNKERRIQIGNKNVIQILLKYQNTFYDTIKNSGSFFVNTSGNVLSDQAVRRMIKKYSSLANIELHITPHMFRHTFATALLEADVDIRYIQEMLGHSSITITEIYTHVATAKQRYILETKHPRRRFEVG